MDELQRAIRRCATPPGTCVLHHVSRTSRAVASVYDAAFRPAALTGQQFNVLMSLAHGDGLNVKALARLVGMDPSTIPRVLGPLVTQRLVRTAVGGDRRQRILTVTAAGRRRLARAVPLWDAVQRQVVEAMGTDVWPALVADLRRIRHALASTEGRKR